MENKRKERFKGWGPHGSIVPTGYLFRLSRRITDKDYQDTYEFLFNIGYHPKLSVHEQFCRKYGLEPDKELLPKLK